MKAMVLRAVSDVSHNPDPLEPAELPLPRPGPSEVRIGVSVCAVCHTELDEIEGRTPPPRFPVVPGHQVVGLIEATGSAVRDLSPGDRVGIAWIYSACGRCSYCRSGRENLCAQFRATGRDADGGYAESMVVPAAFVHRIPAVFSDVEAAPLLCAGAIGYRSVRLAELKDGENLGLTGFGASAHLVLKMVRHRFPATNVFVFARSEQERTFARELGAAWAGGIEEHPPELLHSVIDTTPVWKPIVEALKNLHPGGRLVINAIRKEEVDKTALLALDYPAHLWMEKDIRSVANVTRRDVREFLALAAEVPLKPETEEIPLADANRALRDLKQGRIKGAKVLRVAGGA
jgi:propanol-preferring alcohol dehydrogenase